MSSYVKYFIRDTWYTLGSPRNWMNDQVQVSWCCPESAAPINMGYWRHEDDAGDPGPNLSQSQGHGQCVGNSIARVRYASCRRETLAGQSTPGQALAGMCGRTGPS